MPSSPNGPWRTGNATSAPSRPRPAAGRIASSPCAPRRRRGPIAHVDDVVARLAQALPARLRPTPARRRARRSGRREHRDPPRLTRSPGASSSSVVGGAPSRVVVVVGRRGRRRVSCPTVMATVVPFLACARRRGSGVMTDAVLVDLVVSGFVRMTAGSPRRSSASTASSALLPVTSGILDLARLRHDDGHGRALRTPTSAPPASARATVPGRRFVELLRRRRDREARVAQVGLGRPLSRRRRRARPRAPARSRRRAVTVRPFGRAARPAPGEVGSRLPVRDRARVLRLDRRG